MKKLVFAIAIVATLVVALLSTGNVYAQATTPPQTPGAGYGRGGGRGAGMGAANGEGILHDEMISVYAQEVGITVDDLNARLANGETMAQIAAAQGLTAEQFTALMADARAQAVDQAVKDGTLTQEQVDWMKTRGAAARGMGAGRGAGRGMRGAGTGDPANCPYFTQADQ